MGHPAENPEHDSNQKDNDNSAPEAQPILGLVTAPPMKPVPARRRGQNSVSSPAAAVSVSVCPVKGFHPLLSYPPYVVHGQNLYALA